VFSDVFLLQYADMRNRVAGLRSILDKVRAERSLMQAKLTDLERAAAERNTQDSITVEKIEAGEYVIEALQTRLVRMQAAVVEAEALGCFYKLVVDQCRRNPAKDSRRLECLDQQVPTT
jgi:hypothetical protein